MREKQSPAQNAQGFCSVVKKLDPGQLTPAMYLANRPQLVHLSVTCEFGGGGLDVGSRAI